MRAIAVIFATFGEVAVRAIQFLFNNPRILLFLAGVIVGAIAGDLVAKLALLEGDVRRVFLLLDMLLVPAAMLCADRNPSLSLRLTLAFLCSIMGLLIGRIVYHDLLYIADPGFRSQLVAYCGLALGLFGYMKVKEGDNA